MLFAPLLAVEVTDDSSDADGFRVLELRPTVCQVVISIEELVAKRKREHMGLVGMVAAELEREAEREGASRAVIARRAALGAHKEEAEGRDAEHFTKNKNFIRSTQVVLDIMSGLTPAVKEWQHAFRKLRRQLLLVAGLLLAIFAVAYLSYPFEAVFDDDGPVTCAEEYVGAPPPLLLLQTRARGQRRGSPVSVR